MMLPENTLWCFVPGIIPSTLLDLFLFILTTALGGSYYHYAHFTGEEIESGLSNLLIYYSLFQPLGITQKFPE